ncbi:hypothetical protein Tco_0923440 [Tanacetum coccineum]|uniref:Integrase, catalytic region, zinc finger, CCHC-type, peptidase aspartic, catalytic n=1 Tax=Tanacetum coccineum TaxID=301880 RepID=A0ABQ5D0Z7_9ASTR
MDVEHAFWFHIFNPAIESIPPPIKVEVPSELPKVSLVNASLKKLKFYLTLFDYVVNKRTTPDARTEDLLNEIMKVQTVFNQMDAAVQQFSVDKQCLEIAKKELFLENDRLLQQIMSQDVLLTVMNSMSLIGYTMNMDGKRKESCNLEAELLKSQNAFNDLLKSHTQLEKHCISLEFSIQLNQNKFQKYEYCDNQNALEIPEFFKINDLKAQLQDKDSTIYKLKDIIKSMRERQEIVEQAKEKQPLEKELDFACKHAKQTQELLVYVRDTCPNAIKLNEKKVAVTPKNKVKKARFVEPLTSLSNSKQVESSKTSDSNTPVLSSTGLKCSTSKCGSKPTGNKRNDMISQTPSRNIKNKAESQPRKVNKKNYVVKPIYDVDVKHSLLNANTESICATCKKSLFNGVHDMCFLDFVKNVNSHAKSAKKHKKENIWKPTGHVFTKVGFKWKLTGRTFTIVGNSCPLTRFTSANVVPPMKTTSHLVKTQKPELNVYSSKPKNVKNVDIPSSSSLVMTGYPDCSLLDSGTTILQELWGMVTISWEMDLEVAFWENTCFISNLKGVDLLSGSHDSNLYTISLDDMLKTSSIGLLSKASKTKSWLWHR